MRKVIYISILIISVCSAAAIAKTEQHPNIVLIMTDDVNHDMFNCYGEREINTPNIDQLAAKGVMFQTAWNSAMCGPARAEMMTGCYATTTGFWRNGFSLPLPDGSNDLFKYHTSFSKILNDNGYATAVAGKWHIGGAEHQDNPVLGFDEYCMWESEQTLEKLFDIEWKGGFEATNKTARYWHPCIIKNGTLLETKPTDFGPDIYSDFICDFISRQADVSKPFLAYYPMTMPHGPYVEVPSRTQQGSNDPKNDSKTSNDQRFTEFVEYIDVIVGKIIKQLETSGVAENTIIIFTSDNGTAVTAKTRGVERGCQVPFICAGKGIKNRGMTQELTDITDILPTLVDFAGATYPEGFSCDGVSLQPFLTGRTDKHKEVIHACIGTTQLLRTKDYLLEVVNPVAGCPEGRYYYCGDNHSGHNYIRAEPMEEGKETRELFQEILHEKHIGLNRETPFFHTPSGKKHYEFFTNPEYLEKHLYNHKDYKRYDEILDFD